MNTHQNYYRLLQEIYQTAKLTKLLLRSQNDDNLNLETNIDESDSENDDINENLQYRNIPKENEIIQVSNPNNVKVDIIEIDNKIKYPIKRWSVEQKSVTKVYFKNNIRIKKPSTEKETLIFKKKYP